MKLKWTKKYKEKRGYSFAKDLSIKEKECLKKSCFCLHDWNHDGHLVCITNAKFGCPPEEMKEGGEKSMNENLEELTKKNKEISRQLTALNNEIKELKVRVRQLEQAQTYYPLEYSEINKAGGVNNIKIGETD